ncbi:3-hydroxyacyl-CoA dehydrogenase family protein [Streptomyces sp. L7]
MYEEYKEPLVRRSPLLQRMVDAGRLGRKSGSGVLHPPRLSAPRGDSP